MKVTCAKMIPLLWEARKCVFNEYGNKAPYLLYVLVLVPFSARAVSDVYALVQRTVTVPDIPASMAKQVRIYLQIYKTGVAE